MRIGIDIHGVLDHHPEKFIKLAYSIHDAFRNRSGFGEDISDQYCVHVLTGPTRKKAEKELFVLADRYNKGVRFWDEIHSIVDYVIENNIPHHHTEDGHVWTDKEEDWDRVKGELASKLNLDLHYDDSEAYRKYFPAGVFCHVERKR
jgi:hypothetical protein